LACTKCDLSLDLSKAELMALREQLLDARIRIGGLVENGSGDA
jgi:hypothetical protein